MHIIQSNSIANQVDEILLRRIQEGTYPAGSRIPSESELSEELGVSRATVRTTLAKLAVNGLIIRKQGNGTYVNARVQDISAHLGNLWDLVQLIKSNNFIPSIKALSIERRPATENEAIALAIAPGDELLSLRRLFLADQKPVILANNVIPLFLVHEPLQGIDGSLHIRDILNKYCHKKIAFAITDIRSTVIDSETLADLQGEPNRNMLQLQVAFYGRNNLPLALGVNYFDDAVLRLRLVQAWN